MITEVTLQCQECEWTKSWRETDRSLEALSKGAVGLQGFDMHEITEHPTGGAHYELIVEKRYENGQKVDDFVVGAEGIVREARRTREARQKERKKGKK
jgi:hypothetical protein